MTSPAPCRSPARVFARDFDPPKALEPDSRARFDRLLYQSGPWATVFELDGDRGDPGAAYAFAGQVAIQQCDLLVAVWDGAPGAGHGGTPESLKLALAAHTPVLWLSAQPPFGWRLLRNVEEIACLGDNLPCTPPERTLDPDQDRTRLATALDAVIVAELDLPKGEETSPARPPQAACRPTSLK